MELRARPPRSSPGERRPPATWNRRDFLATGASCALSLATCSILPVGCAGNDADAALVEAVRARYGDPDDAAPIARACGWDLARALRVLRREPGAITGDESLHATLGARIRRDFVDDRLQLLDRRWLSETEIAIAVVVATPRV